MSHPELNESLNSTSDPIEQLNSYCMMLKRNIKLIAIVMGAVILFVLLKLLFIPNIYEARTQILVNRIDQTDKQAIQDLMLPSFVADDDFFGTQIAIISSNKVLDRAGKIVSMDKDKAFVVVAKDNLINKFKSEFFLSNKYVIKIKRKRLTRVIEVVVQGPNAEKCAALANALTQEYIKETMDQNLFVSKQMFSWIDNQEDSNSSPSSITESNSAAVIDSLDSVTTDTVIGLLMKDKSRIQSEIRANAAKYKPDHPVMKELSDSLQIINRDIDIRKDEILKNLKHNLEGGRNLTNVSVLDSAEPGNDPVGPNRLFILFTSIFFGGIFAVGIVSIVDVFNQKIRQVSDLPAHFGAPLLGELPHLDKKQVFELPLNDYIIGIRSHLLFSIPYDQSRCLMVSGLHDREENTLFALYLAKSLCALGRKIVVVDANLRTSKVASIEGNQIEKLGIVDFVTTTTPIERIISRGSANEPDVVSAGSTTLNPVSILSSKKFEELLTTLLDKYDRIILLAPGLKDYPDYQILAKYIDANLMLVHANHDKRRDLLDIKHVFDKMRSRIAGVVIHLPTVT